MNNYYCVGTAQFGMRYGVANQLGKLEQDLIDEIVVDAFDNEIYYFDTAQSYGSSEIVLGRAIEKLEYKNKIKIVSKLSPEFHKSDSDSIIETVKSSIKKLKMKSLYGFLAHRPEIINNNSFIRAIHELKKERLIEKSGVSVYTPEEAKMALSHPSVDILQIPFNITDRRWVDEKIIERSEEYNVQLFFRSIFLQGLIFLNDGELKNRGMYWAKPYLDDFYNMVKETSFSVLELSLGIINKISKDNVIIMGVDNPIQFRENLTIIKKNVIQNNIIDDWWKKLPLFPEKFLNPALWN